MKRPEGWNKKRWIREKTGMVIDEDFFDKKINTMSIPEQHIFQNQFIKINFTKTKLH